MRESDDMRTALRSVLTKGAGNMATQAMGSTADALNTIAGGSASAVVATVAVQATLEALRLGYDSIAAHTQASNDAYRLFVQDYNTGTVSVFLPDDESVRSSRERFFAKFIQLFQMRDLGRSSPLFRYAGIRYTENVEIVIPGVLRSTKKKGTIYSLISMSTLVFAGPFEYARSGDPLLDIALRGSDMFLRSQLPKSLAAIFNYGSPNIFVSLTEHALTTQKLTPKVLRHLDLVRFMILVFANLLVNLQHPSDLDATTNIPLNDEDAITFCGEVIALINRILLPKKSDQFEYLNELYCKDEFHDFIRLVKREAEELQEGYQSKKLKQLNLVELIAQSHGILQALNSLWHQILYLEKPVTEPIQLLYSVRCLSNALDVHPTFWKDLANSYKKEKLPVIAGLNQPYSTVIDLIGLFASITSDQRVSMLSKMKKHGIAHIIIDTLDQLNQSFIESSPSAMTENVAQAFLMNLIAMSVESHPSFLQEAVVSIPGIPTLQQQFSVINDAQILPTGQPPIFTWQFLDSLADTRDSSRTPTKQGKQKYLTSQTVASLKDLLKKQYEFLGALRSLSALYELLESNRNLLLQKNVRNMLKKVLSTLSTKESELTYAMDAIVAQVSAHDKFDDEEKDETSNQRRQYILEMRAEKQGLMCRVQMVKRVIETAAEILDSPIFLKQSETELREAVDAVFASHADFLIAKGALLAMLHLPGLQQPVQLSNDSIERRTSTTRIENEQVQTEELDNSFEQSEGFTANQMLQLQCMLRILRLVGTFFLLVGAIVLLSLTLGASYLPVIAALSSQQFAVGMTMGGGSTLVGGASLSLSCFFKPAVVQNVGFEAADSALVA